MIGIENVGIENVLPALPIKAIKKYTKEDFSIEIVSRDQPIVTILYNLQSFLNIVSPCFFGDSSIEIRNLQSSNKFYFHIHTDMWFMDKIMQEYMVFQLFRFLELLESCIVLEQIKDQDVLSPLKRKNALHYLNKLVGSSFYLGKTLYNINPEIHISDRKKILQKVCEERLRGEIVEINFYKNWVRLEVNEIYVKCYYDGVADNQFAAGDRLEIDVEEYFGASITKKEQPEYKIIEVIKLHKKSKQLAIF